MGWKSGKGTGVSSAPEQAGSVSDWSSSIRSGVSVESGEGVLGAMLSESDPMSVMSEESESSESSSLVALRTVKESLGWEVSGFRYGQFSLPVFWEGRLFLLSGRFLSGERSAFLFLPPLFLVVV